MDLIFHKKLVTHPKILISLVFIVISIFFTLSNSAEGEINEISIESLYKKGIIHDDAFYLRTNSTQKDIVYLKMGRENQPLSLNIRTFLSLNIRTLKIEVSSEEEWEKAKDEKLSRDFYKHGGFIEDKGKLRDIYTRKIIKPSGEHILEHFVSPDDKLVYIYSFSGWYREGSIWPFAPPARKLGVNYFEIWNLEKDEKIFSDSEISFSTSNWPYLRFWLDDRRVMIFTNKLNKSLMVLQY